MVAVGLTAGADDVTVTASSEDGQYQLSPFALSDGTPSAEANRITIDPDKTFQSIVGMGSSFEHATCHNLSLLPAEKRSEIIRKLVHPEDGIGMNLMRVCIGAPDFIEEPYYSYNDLPDGETDPDLNEFSIEKDRGYLLPILKEALAVNPDLLYFASPWSPPGWMKTTGSMNGGKLKEEWYAVYAPYLVKFLQAYQAEGLPMYAITPQNEPAHVDPNYPTTLWTGEEERDFIRDHFGPALRGAGFETLIWCWDHNFNRLEFPRAILSDPQAAQYVDGTGFHHYEGSVDAMTELHNEFPDKHIYFTEGSTFKTRGALRIISFFRNWARSYNAWVIMLDQDRKPNRGPHSASQTCIELNTNDLSVTYNFDYYMYGQFMKFVQRGAKRVESTDLDSRRLGNVAFLNPDGTLALIVANASSSEQEFGVTCGDRTFRLLVPKQTVVTARWPVAEAPQT
jgi:O-glycosyl hydrolase